MIKDILYRALLLGTMYAGGNALQAQELTLSITNLQNNQLEGVNVWINGKHQGTTGADGTVLLNRPNAKIVDIRLSHAALQEKLHRVSLDTLKEKLSLRMDNDQGRLKEVVVTAGRKPESIANIPSSISILTAKEIEMQSQISTNIASVLGNTIPGLGVATSKGTSSGQTLRGRSVLVLIDGIPQSTPLMNGARDIRSIDPSAIERVEVIKGATSIYGNGSAGGIINYITRKNDKNTAVIGGVTTLRGTLAPFYSSETEGYRLSQSLYGRKDKWSYTASGTFDKTGLQRDAEGLPLGQTDGLSNNNQYNAFLKLGYDLNEQSDLKFVYNFFNSLQHARYISKEGKYGETPTIGVRGEDPGENTGTRFNHNAMLTYSHAALFKNTSANISLFYNTFRSMNRYVEKANSWYGPGQSQINSEKKGFRMDLNTSFEIFNRPTELTYGFDILNDVTNQDLTDGRVVIPKMNMVNYAPFAQLTWDVINNLILKGGVRYEYADVKIKDFSTLATGPNGEGVVAVNGGTIPYKGATFNAGLRYNKYDIFNPFVSFSQGFTINELGRIVRSATGSELTDIQSDPIVTDNYEAGFASSFGSIHVSAAYFMSTSKLGVSLIANEFGTFLPQRLPERIGGYEVALDVKINTQWSLGGTYSYVDGKVKAADGTKTYINGSRIMPPKATGYLNFTPSDALNLQLSWVNTGSRSRFQPNDKGVYAGNQGPVTSIDLINFNAFYRLNKSWSIGLGMSNVLNENYYPVYSQYAVNNANYIRGEGANASLNINYKF